MAMLPTLGVDPSINMPAPATGGMFGGGKFGLKEALAFGLAGLVSRRNPQLMQGLMEALMLKQKQAREDAQYAQKRQDDLTDYGKKLQMDAALNPKEPHYFQSNSGDEYAIDPTTGQVTKAFSDPFQYKLVPNGLGGVVPVNIQALMAGSQQPPRPVGKITPIGGQTPPASGGFSY